MTIKTAALIIFLASFAEAATVQLTWRDNATNETGQTIERRLGAVGSPWAEIAKLGANVTAYNDTTAVAGTLYCYRIKAFSDANGNFTEAYSGEVCLVAAADGVNLRYGP